MILLRRKLRKKMLKRTHQKLLIEEEFHGEEKE